jgi:hypothetical protein
MASPAKRKSRVRLVFAVIGVIATIIVVGAVIGALAGGSKGGNASHALEQQIMTDGATQLQANLKNLAGGGTVTMDDVNCVQTANTQQYTCLGHYTVDDPSLGLSNQKYMLNISATCDSNGNCEWHSDGGGQPVG